MSENLGTPQEPQPVEKKKTNTWLIVGIVVIVLCCCCVVIIGLGYKFGDQIFRPILQPFGL
jgi:hypothetical protein